MTLEYTNAIWVISIITVASIILLPAIAWVIAHK
jgi:hypothetical protein